jgi:hypothetical protein
VKLPGIRLKKNEVPFPRWLRLNLNALPLLPAILHKELAGLLAPLARSANVSGELTANLIELQ